MLLGVFLLFWLLQPNFSQGGLRRTIILLGESRPWLTKLFHPVSKQTGSSNQESREPDHHRYSKDGEQRSSPSAGQWTSTLHQRAQQCEGAPAQLLGNDLHAQRLRPDRQGSAEDAKQEQTCGS